MPSRAPFVPNPPRQVISLPAQLEGDGPKLVLDLTEVTLVDVEVARFLGAREGEGVKIVHCPRYIREWMARERANR